MDPFNAQIIPVNHELSARKTTLPDENPNLLRRVQDSVGRKYRQIAQILLYPLSIDRGEGERHWQILDSIERRIYGTSTLEDYEKHEASELKRLARRSLAQFLCQRKSLGSSWATGTRWLAYGLSIVPLFFLLLLRGLRDTQKCVSDEAREAEILIFLQANRHAHSFKASTFTGTYHLYRDICVSLGLRELSFLFRTLMACPRIAAYPELVSNLLRHLTHYGYVVRHYSAHQVVNFFESTPSSSLMTCFLHEHGRLHINLQHGLLNDNVDFAFCCFDEIWVWGEYFDHIFRRQLSQATKFVIVGQPLHQKLFRTLRPTAGKRPPRMLIVDPFMLERSDYDFRALVDLITSLDEHWEIRIRRHPSDRSSELDCLRGINSEPTLRTRGICVTEESPDQISLVDALAKSRIVVGSRSTVLIDAWVAGCKVIHLRTNVDNERIIAQRYGGSMNVVLATGGDELLRFLEEPAIINDAEDQKIDYVTRVLETRVDSTASLLAQ